MSMLYSLTKCILNFKNYFYIGCIELWKWISYILSFLSTVLKFLFFYSLFVLVPLACFPSELIWKYGSYKQSVGLLGRVIIPVPRPLPTQKKCGQISMPWVGFVPTIAVFEQEKTFYAFDCVTTVIGACIILCCSNQLHSVILNMDIVLVKK
jgi:hypothetical protein